MNRPIWTGQFARRVEKVLWYVLTFVVLHTVNQSLWAAVLLLNPPKGMSTDLAVATAELIRFLLASWLLFSTLLQPKWKQSIVGEKRITNEMLSRLALIALVSVLVQESAFRLSPRIPSHIPTPVFLLMLSFASAWLAFKLWRFHTTREAAQRQPVMDASVWALKKRARSKIEKRLRKNRLSQSELIELGRLVFEDKTSQQDTLLTGVRILFGSLLIMLILQFLQEIVRRV